ERPALTWSLLATVAFTTLCNWASWAGQGRLWGEWLPTLVWGGGATLLTMAAVFSAPLRTTRFLAGFLLAVGSTAVLAWLTLAPVHPALSMAAISVLVIVVLLLDLNRLHPFSTSSSVAVLVVVLAVVRLAWAFQAPVGWIALGCDAVAVALLA